jgi:hypothetical protein
VSDRDWLMTLPNTKDALARAEKEISLGNSRKLMEYPQDYDIPITAYRFHSLAGRLGDDDMFSNDLTYLIYHCILTNFH